MFATNYQLTQLIDQRLRFVQEARESGLADDEYLAEMERKIRSCFDKLKKQSCDQRLINRYEAKINKVF